MPREQSGRMGNVQGSLRRSSSLDDAVGRRRLGGLSPRPRRGSPWRTPSAPSGGDPGGRQPAARRTRHPDPRRDCDDPDCRHRRHQASRSSSAAARERPARALRAGARPAGPPAHGEPARTRGAARGVGAVARCPPQWSWSDATRKFECAGPSLECSPYYSRPRARQRRTPREHNAFRVSPIGRMVRLRGERELGNGTTTSNTVPVQVTGLTSGVTAVSKGGHPCAIATGSGIWCWGVCALVDGSTTSARSQVRVTGF